MPSVSSVVKRGPLSLSCFCFCRILDQYQSCFHTASIPDTETAKADCTVTEMEGEVQALERKLFSRKLQLM